MLKFGFPSNNEPLKTSPACGGARHFSRPRSKPPILPMMPGAICTKGVSENNEAIF
jgi:hypothetical protein